MQKSNIRILDVILIICLSITALGTGFFKQKSETPNCAQNAEKISIELSTEDEKPDSFLLNRPGSSYYLSYTENDARVYIAEIFQPKYDSIKNINVTEKDRTFFLPANINQSSLNSQIGGVTGTCSLIAMIIVANFIQLNPKFEINQSNGDRFRELLEISKSKENVYDKPNTAGTKINTIKAIFYQYFVNHSIEPEISDKTFSNMYDIATTVHPPAIAYIDNYIFYENGQFGGSHSIVVTGSITYQVDMLRKPWYYKFGFTTTEYIEVFTICDGWHSSNDGAIGANIQILIPKKPSTTYIQEVINWPNV